MNEARRSANAYLRWWAFAITAPVLVAVLLNVATDPYGILGTPSLEGWTEPKLEIPLHSRLVKPRVVCALEPEALILGGSHLGLGLTATHLGWRARPVYNFGIPIGNFYEYRRYFEHAHAHRRLRQVVLGLDFPSFNELYPRRVDFDDSMLGNPVRANDTCAELGVPWGAIASWDAVRSSGRTLKRNWRGVGTWFATPDGDWHWRRHDEVVAAAGGIGPLFSVAERALLGNHFLPGPTHAFVLAKLDQPETKLDDFRFLVRTAIRDHVDLRIFFPPFHARIFEMWRVIGLWEEYERWKRAIVAIVESEVERAPGRTEIPVWDFGEYNSITTEEVPPERGGEMKNYGDPVHYLRPIGDLVLDRLLDAESPARPIPMDFGAQLTAANIDAAIMRSRASGAEYRAHHPRDVRDVETIVRESFDDWSRRAFAPAAR